MVGSHGLWHQEKEAVMFYCHDCQNGKDPIKEDLCDECRENVSLEIRWQFGPEVQQWLDDRDQQQ